MAAAWRCQYCFRPLDHIVRVAGEYRCLVCQGYFCSVECYTAHECAVS